MSAPFNQTPAQTQQAMENHLKSILVPILTFFGYMADLLPKAAAAVSIGWMLWQWWHHPKMVEIRDKRKRRKAR